jgi:hypothetical protein
MSFRKLRSGAELMTLVWEQAMGLRDGSFGEFSLGASWLVS